MLFLAQRSKQERLSAKSRHAVYLAELDTQTTAVGTVHGIAGAILGKDSIAIRKELRAASEAVNRVASIIMHRKTEHVDVAQSSGVASFLTEMLKQGAVRVFKSFAGALFTAFARAAALVCGSVVRVFVAAAAAVLRVAAAHPYALGTIALLGAAAYGYKKYRDYTRRDTEAPVQYAPATQPRGGEELSPTYKERPEAGKLAGRVDEGKVDGKAGKLAGRVDEGKVDGKAAGVRDIVKAAAARHNVPPDLALKIAFAESTLNPNAKAKTSSAKGLFQFTDDTWADMGGRPGTQFDPEINADLGARYISRHYRALGKVLTRPVTDGDVYLMHFLGPGAAKMLAGAHPSWSIERGLALISARKAYAAGVMRSNPFLRGMTVGQFYQWAAKKMSVSVPADLGVGAAAPTAPDSALSAKPGFIVPASGVFTSSHGERMHPVKKVLKMHHGIDIAAAPGTPIYAAADGEVVTASTTSVGYGTLIVIDHGGGLTTRYAHSRKLYVQEGQVVRQGQRIAEVGSEGWSTGPHLHFEVRRGAESVDPAAMLPGLPAKKGTATVAGAGSGVGGSGRQASAPQTEFVRSNGRVVALN